MSDLVAGALLRDTALHLALLSRGASMPELHVWRARCATLVEELCQALDAHGMDAQSTARMALAQCLLLDQATLDRLRPDQRQQWERLSLRSQYGAGEDGVGLVCRHMDELLNAARPDTRLLQCYALLLRLGLLTDEGLHEDYLRRLLPQAPPAPARPHARTDVSRAPRPAWLWGALLITALAWWGAGIYLDRVARALPDSGATKVEAGQ